MSTSTIGRACCAALLAASSPGAVGPPAGSGKAPRFILARGKKGDKPEEFYSPIGIAIDDNGLI